MVAVLGVDEARLYTSVFVLGSCLAGLAGALQVRAPGADQVHGHDGPHRGVRGRRGGRIGIGRGPPLAAILIGVSDAFGVLVLPGASLVLTSSSWRRS